MFNTPNDLQWRSELEPMHTESNNTFIGEIIDAHGDGNYTDAFLQSWSVRLVGWGTEIYSCRAMVPHGSYNGAGEYHSYKKGDVVMLIAREGQMEELLIIGSIRLNGDLKKLEEEGQGLKFGEMPTGASGKPVPANQVSLHPSRVTKMDSYMRIYGSNNLINEYSDPALGQTLEERQGNQPIPGVYTSVNKEGVYVTYAHGGIVNYTDGNLVFVSNGSKQNKCTKFLAQAKRHLAIATQLKSLAILRIQNIETVFDFENLEDTEFGFSELPGLEIGAVQTFDGAFSISENTPVFSPWSGKALNESAGGSDFNFGNADGPIFKTGEEGSFRNIGFKPSPEDDPDLPTLTAEDIRDPAYRARKHEELAKLAQETAEDCNRNFSAYHQQANLMAESVGNHFGQGGTPSIEVPKLEPTQFFGNVDPNNYSSRTVAEGISKPPVTIETAHPNNYDVNDTQGPHLPIKRIFLHHTNKSLRDTIDTFKDPKKEVSAHYTIDRDGKIYQHVPDNKRAYHSAAAGNSNSIGIEHVATETDKGFTKAQEEASIKLIKYLVATYDINKTKIAGHRTVYDTKCPSFIWPTEESLRQWVDKNI